MSSLATSLLNAMRVVAVCLCACAIWQSLKLARADAFYRQDTPEAVSAAIHLDPDNENYYMRLAANDREHARPLLLHAVALNPYNAQAYIELGLEYEADGDLAAAEKCLRRAFAVDRTYLTRWTLANFYLRQNDLPAFWAWARKAAEMPAANLNPLFELCWRVSSDPGEIASRLLTGDPDVIRAYLGFLAAKNEPGEIATLAPRLLEVGNADQDRPALLDAVDQLVRANDGDHAYALWRQLLDRQWIEADRGWPNNPQFSRQPQPVAFDWWLPESNGVQALPGTTGLDVEFSGSEPEECIVAQQALPLSPGLYTLQYRYQTKDIAPETGVHWEVLDSTTGLVLAASQDLASNESVQTSFQFDVPRTAQVQYLRLAYKRALGTTRIAGTLTVSSTMIRSVSHI